MPRGKKAPVVEYVVITNSEDVYFYNTDKGLLDFLNETDEPVDEEKVGWTVLPKLPVPKYQGNYCPTSHEEWPSNGVVIFKNGSIFVPTKNTIEKKIVSYEYTVDLPVPSAKRRGRPPSKKTRKSTK